MAQVAAPKTGFGCLRFQPVARVSGHGRIAGDWSQRRVRLGHFYFAGGLAPAKLSRIFFAPWLRGFSSSDFR